MADAPSVPAAMRLRLDTAALAANFHLFQRRAQRRVGALAVKLALLGKKDVILGVHKAKPKIIAQQQAV